MTLSDVLEVNQLPKHLQQSLIDIAMQQFFRELDHYSSHQQWNCSLCASVMITFTEHTNKLIEIGMTDIG